jgi:hypothetical protein
MNKQPTPRILASRTQEPLLPGTPEALALGCRCPLANDPGYRDAGLVIYFGNCPVHKPLVDRLERSRHPAETPLTQSGSDPGTLAS